MPILVNGILYGDWPGNLVGHKHAGSQTLDLSTLKTAAIGDVDALLDHSTGGDDIITGPSPNVIGDASTIDDHAKGGNDTVTVSGFGSTVYGDARTMTDHGRGGDDTLTSHSRSAQVVGDAKEMDGHTRGTAVRHAACLRNSAHDEVASFGGGAGELGRPVFYAGAS